MTNGSTTTNHMQDDTYESKIPKEDAEWIKESIPNGTQLPEAPISIHIDSYLHGFHIGWTKRLDETSLISQIMGIKAFVKELKDQEFMPSWNSETNEKAISNGQAKIPEVVDFDSKCQVHKVGMQEYTSKYDGSKFYSHFVGVSEQYPKGYCNGKFK